MTNYKWLVEKDVLRALMNVATRHDVQTKQIDPFVSTQRVYFRPLLNINACSRYFVDS